MVEGELLSLALFVLYLFTRLLGQDWRLNLFIFFLGACWGFVAQLLLGAQWNRYSVNVHFYIGIGYVSFALIEFLGSNLLRMKLYDYARFRPILPWLNARHAPLWLYGYYFLVNSTFYFGLKFLGLARRFYQAADN